MRDALAAKRFLQASDSRSLIVNSAGDAPEVIKPLSGSTKAPKPYWLNCCSNKSQADWRSARPAVVRASDAAGVDATDALTGGVPPAGGVPPDGGVLPCGSVLPGGVPPGVGVVPGAAFPGAGTEFAPTALEKLACVFPPSERSVAERSWSGEAETSFC